jgi:glycosyltransferase involved in cell wall biosynthesis
MKTKVLYIISDIDKAIAFEWIAEQLDREKYTLEFLLLNPGDSALEDFLRKNNYPVTRYRCRGKRDWIGAFFKVLVYLLRTKPDVIHCHLLQANIIGLTAARLAGVRRRIYTRHHSSLHHVYHPKGVFWDKLANALATDIVAISDNVRRILMEWEHVPAAKIRLIYHGFLLDSFRYVPEDRVKKIRTKYELQAASPVIGAIARFTEWKGVQYIVTAFKEVLQDHPQAMLLLFNGVGDYADEINQMLGEIPRENYRVIKFENDIGAALHAMDVFVHVPIDSHAEAFGQIYIEALAAGVPSVFTLSGIAVDFVRDGENALVVPFKDAQSIHAAINRLIEDRELRAALMSNGQRDVYQRFLLDDMLTKLGEMYTARLS